MKITEKAAYLKGLADGLALDPQDKVTKVIKPLLDLVQEMSNYITDLEQCYDDVCDRMDDFDEDLAAVEELLYEDEEEDEDDDETCPFCGGAADGEAAYEVVCPSCQTVIGLTEEDISKEGTICPTCGEALEFDYDEDELDAEDSEEADTEAAEENKNADEE